MDCIIAGKIFSQEKPASNSHIHSLTQEITLKWNNHFSYVMNTQTGSFHMFSVILFNLAQFWSG